jgi:hypothetical protein
MRTQPRRPRGSSRPPRRIRLCLEALESRLVPSGTPLPTPVLEITPANTLDLTGPVIVSGNIGGAGGGAGVDWYNFTLTRAGTVALTALPQSGQADPVVSLYNNDPFDFSDPYDPLGYRLLTQAQGASGGPTTLTRDLAPGTYFVAVSGAGNRSFNPFLAGSGYPGATGGYTLGVSATDLGLAAVDGPVVLTTTPDVGQALADSPLIVRVDLIGSLDPNTVTAGQSVNLLLSPTPTFGGAAAVPLASVSYSDQIAELQLVPAHPLAPGYYEIVLAGDTTGSVPVLADPNGVALGTDGTHPNGQDYTAVFQVNGIDGTAGAVTSDDTTATAHDLGDVTGAGLIQAVGSIGGDPAYDPASPDPNLANPAADVDLYRFQVTGPGQYAFSAEVFAGRIGSPLDAGLSLFSVNSTGQLVLMASNDNTLNTTAATNGQLPLATDAALFSGLTAGTYYLAVSGTGNVPNSTAGQLPGTNGIFDPNFTHSGQSGFTTGDYVLNFAVQPVYTTPQVMSVAVRTDTDLTATTGTPLSGASLDAPPTLVEVQFSKPVNLQQLAFQASQQGLAGLSAVTVSVPPPAGQSTPAQVFHPLLLDYDPATGLARFLMLDAVPSGPYAQRQTPALHLSGAGSDGLADLAGNPLAGGGEVVVPFSVNGPSRGTGANPLLWTAQEPNDSLGAPQALGVLFPNELHSKVLVQRSPSAAASDTADYISFSVVQSQSYFLSVTGTGLPNTPIAVYSVAGQQWPPTLALAGGQVRLVNLGPGQYVVKVGDWTAPQAPNVSYTLSLRQGGSAANPSPLTVGPAPAVQLTPESKDPNERFVVAAYQDLLHRTADALGQAGNESLLNARVSRGDVALGIETSTEYSTNFVQGLYQTLLHRTPAPQEVNGWVAVLNGGWTWDQVQAGFLASPEYYATRGGGDDAGWLNAVYQDVPGRAVDSAGQATWGWNLAHGMSREQVARRILRSDEASRLLVDDWYQTYLHRPADPQGLAGWSGLLQAGVSEEVVLASIIGSPEYGNLH